MAAKFELGQTVITRHALSVLSPESVRVAMGRHMTGDWGEPCEDDKRANESALIHGGRLFSAYHDANNIKFWIITEADRSATTVLLPEDY